MGVVANILYLKAYKLFCFFQSHKSNQNHWFKLKVELKKGKQKLKRITIGNDDFFPLVCLLLFHAP